MSFSPLDISIVVVYLVSVTVAGILIAGKQSSSRDYFLGGKSLPWWSVGFSIVASETSTLTFISVPGLAYKSNFYFLQLAVGYFVGRMLVSFIFIPAYYRGEIETAYDFIGKRFGLPLRRFSSTIFIITRVLASGVQLFATAIPIHIITGLDYRTSILLIGSCTLLYTYLGGLKAVVAMDVVQLFIYLGGAVVSLLLILHRLPGGWSDVVRAAASSSLDKFAVVNTHWGSSLGSFLSSPYTLLGSLLGGTFLTMASHGTDQLLVQRLLSCRTPRDSQRALILDASLIVIQFAFFLLLGSCLFAYYGGKSLVELGVQSSDEIFPRFIVQELPHGIAGLLIAGVLASAMGTLSSSVSALASSSYLDIFRVLRPSSSHDHGADLRWSKFFTLVWGIVLIGGAMLFTDTKNPVVELGLRVASITYGGLLGTFLLGFGNRRVDQFDATLGFVSGLVGMLAVVQFTAVDFTWHTCVGCIVTVGVGSASSLLRRRRAIAASDRT